MADYFYDQQIRRLIHQICRMLGGFEVHTGIGRDGQVQVRQVPCRWGEPSRMVSHIQRQLSENTMLSTPISSIHITGINAVSDRRQNPTHVDTKLVDEREFDDNTGQYTENLGDRFTLKRYMPVPYTFNFQWDIWTSNQDQKMQILEQVMMLFNPSIDLQTSDNPLDWTAITFVTMDDDIVWTSRSIPMGTDDPIDISSVKFTVPYWINPPAELTRRRAIENLISSMQVVQDLPENDLDFAWEENNNLNQSVITPGNNIIEVVGNEIVLLSENGASVDDNGNMFNWRTVLSKYSDFNDVIQNKIEIKRRFGDPAGVSGFFTFHITDENRLVWDIDPSTLPQDTLPAITAIIDPSVKYPGNGLLAVNIGQRYLIVEDIISTGSIWGNADIPANSIIEYDGSSWIVTFDSTGNESLVKQNITNEFTSKQLRWNPEIKDWEFAIDGKYKPGTWKIIS